MLKITCTVSVTPPNHVCSPVPTARPPPAPGSGAFAGWSPCRALPLGQRAAGRRERRGWPQPAARATRTRGRAGAWTGGPWGQRLLVGSGPSTGAPFLASRSEESDFPCTRVCTCTRTHTGLTYTRRTPIRFLWGDAFLGLNGQSCIQSTPPPGQIYSDNCGVTEARRAWGPSTESQVE